MVRNLIRLILFVCGCGFIACSSRNTKAPILVLATGRDFGTYTTEILKTEGFNEFELDSVSGGKVTISSMKRFDLVILAESGITKKQKQTIREYVRKGGNLVAVNPDPDLGDLFGITPLEGNISEGYMMIDTSSSYGRNLASGFIRIHGSVRKYKLDGGKGIAALFSNKSDREGYPVVVCHDFAKGHTVAFLYNLSQSIVYSRQGNPKWAGQEKDSIPGLRAMDMFTEGWVDTSSNTINAADQQMALLTHSIESINAITKPLPRFWYFPDSLKCLVTLTNDGEYKKEADFEPQFRDVDSMGAKMSLYIIGVDNVTREWVDLWTAKGFEISGHPDDTKEAGNPSWKSMDSVLSVRKYEIESKYGLPMRTNVNHWFVWCGTDSAGSADFAAEARLEEKNGIEMDINYAHYDIKSNQGINYLGQPGINQGNFTGSGLVMRFADIHGKIINVYQHLNAVYDQQYNESHDPEGFYNAFKGLVDRSLSNDVYSFISVKSHNDEYYFSKVPLMKMLAYANQNQVPVWTAVKLLDFLKMRDQASFEDIAWSNNQLLFNINSSLNHSLGLTFIVPSQYGNKEIIGITNNGADLRFITRHIRGTDYAMASVKPGENHSIAVIYGTTPRGGGK